MRFTVWKKVRAVIVKLRVTVAAAAAADCGLFV